MISRKIVKVQFRRRFRQCLLWQLSATIIAMNAGLGWAAGEPISVFTSLLPHAEFVAIIGGPQVKVESLVGPGHSPANYQPTPRQMAKLAGAQLYVAAEVPFEAGLLPKIKGAHKNLLLVGDSQPNHVGHDGHDGHDGHAENPHAWLDPLYVAVLADAIAEQLSILAPAHAAEFSQRRDEFKAKLKLLDERIAEMLHPYIGREFFVFHPAYGHFAARYGLVQVAVEDAGHEPGAQHLVKIIEQAIAANASVIVVQPQFSQRSAAAVAESCSAEVLVLDPLAKDYEANLLHIAQMLANAWEVES